MTLIIGAGGGKSGGGGSSRVSQESPDSLRSRSFARIMDLICEGEIEGLTTQDAQSIYFDKTPLMNADGTFNFSGVTTATRNGTQSQSYIPGFPNVESEQSVDTRVLAATPIVRAISDTGVDSIRVTVGIPQLSQQNTTNGDITGASINIAIDVQPNAGSYTEVINDTITGKTTTRYQRSYLIKLEGASPWNVRVRRITADSASAALQNQTYWDSYTVISSAKLTYPNSALVATIIDSSQFSNIPTRAFDMKLLRTQIPSNATVREDGSLEYSGSWDGTFQIAWHSNPAWAFYDLVVTNRYGLGDYLDAAEVDKWALYSIGQYCDVQVPNGFGGFEARFSCNIYMQSQEEAFNVLRDMASIFRGMMFWDGGLITAVQDAPVDAIALYTNANVVDGLFTYAGSSLKTRHSVALVTWNDPANFYEQRVEYVEDAAAISRYGIVSTSISALGCTSRAQANRAGKWLLYSEANETETVSFRVGREGIYARPGQVISVHDADRAGLRLGGRVQASSSNTITVDKAVDIVSGGSYTMNVVLPDGTIFTSGVVSAAAEIVTLSDNFITQPNPDAVWILTTEQVTPQQFRVVSVIEADNGIYEITGLEYNSTKYDAIEQGITLVQNPISSLNVTPAQPSSVTITESLYQTSTEIKVLVTIAWNAVPNADSYIVSYKRDDGNLITVANLDSPLYEIRDAQPGLYTANVYAVSIANKRSTPATAVATILGKTARPADVQNFTISGIAAGVAYLSWQQASDLDVLVGGYVRIRYAPNTGTPSWENAIDIGEALPGSATSATIAHIDGVYFAKFIDSSGKASVNAASISTEFSSLLRLNVIETIDESTFAGVMTDTVYSDELEGLILTGSVDWDDLPGDVDDFDSIDYEGGTVLSGTYDFANTVDLGAVYTSLITAAMTVQAFDSAALFDSNLSDIDDWGDIDGAAIDDVNAGLYIRTTNDDPTGSPTWSDWIPFFVTQYTARAYQFQLRLTSQSPTHNIAVKELSVIVDMPDRTEAEYAKVSGAGTYSVTFPNAFWARPAIALNAQNMATGDYYVVASQDETGFDVTFRNAAGTAISRTFDYIAKGYGIKY